MLQYFEMVLLEWKMFDLLDKKMRYDLWVVVQLEACGGCGKILSDKLQRLENGAARVLTYSSYDADANELLKILGWKNLETQCQIHKAQMVYKSLNGLAPSYLSSKFIQRSDIIITSSDSENKLVVSLLPRTNYYKKYFQL